VLCLGARFGWWNDREAALVEARAYADKALEIDPGNADAHVTSGILFWVQKRYDEAVADARRAIQLAPGSADVADFASHILAQSSYPEEAIPLSKKAIALNPNHPPVYLGSLGQAYRLAGQTEEAIAAFKAFNARSPGFGLIDLVIIYQESGRADDAKQTAKLLLTARPNFAIASWLKTQLLRDTARLDADVAALRAAGLPTG
jgi:adenylate cyclase